LLDGELKFELEFNKDPRTIDEAVFYAVTWVQLRGKDRRGATLLENLRTRKGQR